MVFIRKNKGDAYVYFNNKTDLIIWNDIWNKYIYRNGYLGGCWP